MKTETLNLIQITILRTIAKNNGGTFIMKDFAKALRSTIPTASVNVNVLIRAGFIQRDGKSYTLPYDIYEEVRHG